MSDIQCKHCKEFSKNEFCCNGCKVAYSLINAMNLQQFYKYCTEIDGSVPKRITDVESCIDYTEYVVDNKVFDIYLYIDGVHCSSCIWLIENALRRTYSLDICDMNMVLNRLHIRWNGEKKLINDMAQTLLLLGYRPSPNADSLDVNESHKERELLFKVGVAGFVSVALMMFLWVTVLSNDRELSPDSRFLIHLFSAIIALPTIIYCGFGFFSSAVNAIRTRSVNMDIPISIGVIAAAVLSMYDLFVGGKYLYFDAAVGLIFFLLGGRYLEMKTRNKANQFARSIVFSQPKSAVVLEEGRSVLKAVESVNVGDRIVVSSGDKIPVDGIVVEGMSCVDNSLITGESDPISVCEKSQVLAGTTNLDNVIIIEALKTSASCYINEMIRMIENIKNFGGKYVELADRVSRVFTPITLLVSAISFLVWMFLGAGVYSSLKVAATILIITCPCALALAVPLVQTVVVSFLMKRGIMVKSKNALEKLNCITKIIFDKTGTLTKGSLGICNADDFSDYELGVISSIAMFSKHPISRSLSRVSNKAITLNSVEEIKGAGIKGLLRNEVVILGSGKFVGAENINDGYVDVWFKLGDGAPKRIKLSDSLKDDAVKTMGILKEMEFNPLMLSGDRESVCRKIADVLDINYYSERDPSQKNEVIESVTNSGERILMVGDGLNDAVALKGAYVSMSPANSLELAKNSADIVINKNKVNDVVLCIRAANNLSIFSKQNLVLALLYNCIFVPVAFMGLINPLIAAFAMSSSSIIVVLNSLRIENILSKFDF